MKNETCFFYWGNCKVFELDYEDALAVSHQGDCNEDARELAKRPDIAEKLDAIDANELARELQEYGAWDAAELSDHQENLYRFLWIAGCQIREEEEPSCTCAIEKSRRKTHLASCPLAK